MAGCITGDGKALGPFETPSGFLDLGGRPGEKDRSTSMLGNRRGDMRPLIRPARLEDAARLVELVDALNASEQSRRGAFTLESALEDGFGASPAFEVLLAELGGRVAGYVLWHASYSTEWAQRGIYVEDLYVEPEARRAGVGRALLAALAAEAKRRELRFVWWCSRPGNKAANAFYETLADIHEPIIAHALARDAFERLAAEGEANGA
jgi:ribosomal protein S18 acetylase RimI-like enzyme